MKKQDLTDSMILELRNGERYLFTNGQMLDFDGFLRLENYSEDLKNKLNKGYDIVKVYENVVSNSLTDIFKDENLSLLWEREETKLPDREIEVLKALRTIGYRYIARDGDGKLFAYEEKPEKITNCWWRGKSWYLIKKDENIFNFIKWEDAEPTIIDELLKGI